MKNSKNNQKQEGIAMELITRFNTPKEKTFSIYAQAFYGNRTMLPGLNDEEMIDAVLSGNTSVDDYNRLKGWRETKKVIYEIPGTDLLLIYDECRENEIRNYSDFALWKPCTVIPELNLELYSRCIAVKKEGNGYGNMTEEDVTVINQYFLL